MIKDKIHNSLYYIDRTRNTQRFAKIEFSLILGLYRLVSNREE